MIARRTGTTTIPIVERLTERRVSDETALEYRLVQAVMGPGRDVDKCERVLGLVREYFAKQRELPSLPRLVDVDEGPDVEA